MIKRLIAILLLPIVFPISLVIWLFQSIFSPKTVTLSELDRQELQAGSDWLRALARDFPIVHTKQQLEEAAEYLQRASAHDAVKRGALEDYRRDVQMLSEMNLTGRTGAAKFIQMSFLIWAATKRLEVKQ